MRAELREPDPRLAARLQDALEAAGIEVVGRGQAVGPRTVVLWAIDVDGVEALDRAPRSHRVVALVDRPTPEVVSRLLAAGARSVVDRGGDVATIAGAAVAVARGYLVLASDRWADLLPPSLAGLLSDTELEWMRQLATGSEVAPLAVAAGCSEREMYRRLRAVYGKLQAADRADALRLLDQAGAFGGRPGGIRR